MTTSSSTLGPCPFQHLYYTVSISIVQTDTLLSSDRWSCKCRSTWAKRLLALHAILRMPLEMPLVKPADADKKRAGSTERELSQPAICMASYCR